MRVRLLTGMVTTDGHSWAYGQIVDLPPDVAARLLASGQAAPVAHEPVEQATVEPPERAVHPANRRRRGRA